MNTKRITYYGLLTAFGVLLPFIFHFAIKINLFGYSLGQYLLPLHYGAYLAGLFFGPIGGLIVGIATPLLSSAITSMPAAPMLWFFTAEIAIYGITVGFLYYKKHINIYISMISAMIIGRLSLVALVFFIGKLILGKAMLLTTTLNLLTVGLAGELIQLLIIPVVVKRVNSVFNFSKRG